MENPEIAEIFTAYHEYLKTEQDMREDIRSAVQNLEQTAREILITLQKIHQSADVSSREQNHIKQLLKAINLLRS